MEIQQMQQLAREHSLELGLVGLAQIVHVRWNSRMRSAAGRAFCHTGIIELNPGLCEISEEELHRTFLHELAHLVAYARNYPKRIAPHGTEWRDACRDLGIPKEKVTHNLPLVRREQVRQWHYSCSHCNLVISRVRRMKAKGAACLVCCKKYNGGRYSSRYALIEHQRLV
jgi:SprT protein